MKQTLLARLAQPSTWIGIASALLTIATTGISAVPSAAQALLVALGLIVVNA